ncbi:MAG: DUF1285 domain-containing protein [Alphaproteobacteria bacterium]|nr:DUF1285 domain-containing protein [Alphaproteobacteria bacterium]
MHDHDTKSKARKKPNFAELMKHGGGLSGVAWPENCSDFDMRIATDGTWFYRGSPIGRKPLVKLFATALQRDTDGQYWLVTPVERGLVSVDDAPFVIVEMQQRSGIHNMELHMRTNLDHWIRLDAEHPLTMRKAPDGTEDRPYVHVRDDLDALINRAVYYDLVELAEFEGAALVVHSAEQVFILGNLEEVDAN